MREEIFYCDKCKQKVKNSSELKTISFGFGDFNGYGSSLRVITRYDLCTTCREKLKLVERVIKADKIEERDTPDLKDKLYDVMCQLVQDLGYQGE